MSKPFDITLFLSGVLTGSKSSQQRHLRQARIMQMAIKQRWRNDNPWTWRKKHVDWYLRVHLKEHSASTRYYYQLTILLICKRMNNNTLLR
ncbi:MULTISPECIES: hypothetical protein [unclassified Pseudomonas]|uniref:hypothetical protein n=1 Tax=unclassified Pseudomonas TaxID=196821 RepID=UPI000C88C656|nr:MULTISPECIES: hypothetical protein [unclassified Pseudomonas]PMZ92906.1 hypothetical protein C1X79_19020 [Pseudomonas sp. FW305-42]PNA20778.1 hypothetical protein C1X78_21020 [Pseudomonas sp. MPR-R1B]PNB23555.1 hypothetical protein C1X80_18620 [Pseudomonas sp. DP16D-E2]PNB41334.1 hypothetical protein C1X75_20945 [Pseudomonas sp. FW305-17]PNB59473.1 hypothetical protein C1X77_15915 [Pseudomonas sp. GW531-E2]